MLSKRVRLSFRVMTPRTRPLRSSDIPVIQHILYAKTCISSSPHLELRQALVYHVDPPLQAEILRTVQFVPDANKGQGSIKKEA